MRLINTRTLCLEEYFGDKIPKYAILSHTWGNANEEVTYQDWLKPLLESKKKGYRKIQKACSVARRQKVEFLWVDTNCINKDSSSELSEAINSMFTWYQRACVCFVYLNDFHYNGKNEVDIGTSRWFTRGWTLQELLAPNAMQFFDVSWTYFGTKDSLLAHISRITSIHIQYLVHPDSIYLASVARRMSWVATRSTTREEDMAYCLLGIFQINMPLLYGEGSKAFVRLQEEIIRYSDDHTIFSWSWMAPSEKQETTDWRGCLAPRPIAFRDSGDFIPTNPAEKDVATDFQLTNSGLRIRLPLLNALLGDFRIAMLNVKHCTKHECQIWLCVRQVSGKGIAFARLAFLTQPLNIPPKWVDDGKLIYLAHERDPNRTFSSIAVREYIYPFSKPTRYALFPMYPGRDNKIYSTIKDRMLPPESNGAFVSLLPDTEEDAWWTRMLVKLPNHPEVEINIYIWMDRSEHRIWHATSKMRPATDAEESRAPYFMKETSLLLETEFTIESGDEPTLVRPIILSFSELLLQES